MKIAIEVSDKILQMIVDMLADDDIKITAAKLKKNPDLKAWFQNDMDVTYFDRFEEGLGDCSIAEDLDLE